MNIMSASQSETGTARGEGQPPASSSTQAVTVRGLAVGLGMALLVIVWNTYVEYIAHTARMNITHFPIALFVPYTVLALGNAGLRRRRIPWALTSAEMLTVVAMGLIAAAVPAYGLTSYFLGMISVPFYLATPENQWADYFHQYLPTWLLPSNHGHAMEWLYEGLPSSNMAIPWEMWILPLAWWLALIAAIVAGSACLAVMLRKQWAENERLAYPILHAAGDLAGAEEHGPFLNNPFLWIGLAVPLLIHVWNIAGTFSLALPHLRLGPGWMTMGSHFPRIHVRLNFYTVGFAYFANVDVLFSIWAFYLFYCVQVWFYRRIGISLSPKGGSGDATTGLQAGGAFLALVLWGLWIARHHLRDVVLKAVRPDHPVDDRNELLSYRFCVIGLGLSLLFIVLWLHAVGFSWIAAFVFCIGLYIAYLGVARVIAETGVVYYSMPLTPEAMVPFVFGGPNGIDAHTHTGLQLVNAIRCQNKAMFMPPLVHAARIGDSLERDRRRLALGIVLTLVMGMGTAIAYTLYLGYTHGAYNFNDFPFARYPPRKWQLLVRALKGDEPWEMQRYTYLALGGVIFTLVGLMRHRFAWWPLAPIGMAVPPTHAIHSMFSIFVAWCLKTVILRIGGVEYYRRLRPVFLGLLIGHALGVLIGFVVDQIWFPGQGHHTHSW